MVSVSDRSASAAGVAQLRRINRLGDRLPPHIVLLAFFAAAISALASGFAAAAAIESESLGDIQDGVELIAGYSYQSSSSPCQEILPFGLVVPAAHSTVVKCIVVSNRSSASITGLTLIDTDVGDGPVWIESIPAGEQLFFDALVASDGDLTSTTSLTITGSSVALRVHSRTFVVDGAVIAGTIGVDRIGAEVALTGRTQTGQRLDLTSVAASDGRFEFADLPPSDESGYRVAHDDVSLAERPVILIDGDQVNITDEPLPLTAASNVAEPADEPALASTPPALPFEPGHARSNLPLEVPLLVISGLIVALAIPIRRAPPARQ